jgi:hypothetical protein
LKNGVLLVESDHPGWIQYLNFYKKFIINGIKMAIPEVKVFSLAFRVAGSEVSLSEKYEDSVKRNQEILEKKLAAQEEAVRKYVEKPASKSGQSEKKGELPPELAAKFDSIIQNMLTNSENK